MNLYRYLNKRNYAKLEAKLQKAVRKADDLRAFLFSPYRGVFGYHLKPHRVVNKTVWRWQRSKRGWADCDTWSTDSYAARVLSEMLSYMAEHTYSYPGTDEWDTPEKWEAHLKDLARRLMVWNADTFTDTPSFDVTKAAMEEFARNFGRYWD